MTFDSTRLLIKHGNDYQRAEGCEGAVPEGSVPGREG